MDNFVLILYLIYTKFATEKYNLPKTTSKPFSTHNI